jgi:methylmalonyl-CoA mutase
MENVLNTSNHKLIGQLISAFENYSAQETVVLKDWLKTQRQGNSVPPVLGITGTGGAGKSSLVDELVRRFLLDFEDKTLALFPSTHRKRKTGGALLGDRIRMNAINPRGCTCARSPHGRATWPCRKYVQEAVDILKAAHYRPHHPRNHRASARATRRSSTTAT